MGDTEKGFYPGRANVAAYGRGGFVFAGMSHVGSILALPSGIHAWAPTVMEDVNLELLSPVIAESAEISIFILGTGASQVFPTPDIMLTFKDHDIALEVMDTGAAIPTYNLLLGEGRPVAAGLLATAYTATGRGAAGGVHR